MGIKPFVGLSMCFQLLALTPCGVTRSCSHAEVVGLSFKHHLGDGWRGMAYRVYEGEGYISCKLNFLETQDLLITFVIRQRAFDTMTVLAEILRAAQLPVSRASILSNAPSYVPHVQHFFGGNRMIVREWSSCFSTVCMQHAWIFYACRLRVGMILYVTAGPVTREETGQEFFSIPTLHCYYC